MFIHMNMLHSKTFEHRRYDSNPFQVVSDCESPKVPSHQCRVETRIADGSLGLYILNNMSQLFFFPRNCRVYPHKYIPTYFPTIFPNNISPQPPKSIQIPQHLPGDKALDESQKADDQLARERQREEAENRRFHHRMNVTLAM